MKIHTEICTIRKFHRVKIVTQYQSSFIIRKRCRIKESRVFHIRRRWTCTIIFSSGRHYGGKNKVRSGLRWLSRITVCGGVYAEYHEYIPGHESRSIVRLCRYTIRSIIVVVNSSLLWTFLYFDAVQLTMFDQR